MKKHILTLLAVVHASSAQTTLWNEGIHGDMSSDYTTPTTFTASAGDMRVIGALGGGGSDRDLFTLTVPAGHELRNLTLVSFTTTGAPGNVSFMGMQSGNTLSQGPSNMFSDPIGYVLYGNWAVGQDILPSIVNGPPFNNLNPLPAGDYAIWMNETGASSTYQLGFNVAAVPVPEAQSTLLIALSFALPVFVRRRNK